MSGRSARASIGSSCTGDSVKATAPTVVVRPPQPAARESARSLAAALREGAFAVLDRPVHLETMLQTMRRVLRRHYADHWPAA